jgi:hypothetical protein
LQGGVLVEEGTGEGKKTAVHVLLETSTRRGSGTMQFLTQEELKRLFAAIKDKHDSVG